MDNMENTRKASVDMGSNASVDSTGKKKSFRRLITRFAEKTSMQGPPYINMAKFWWAKLIWAILLLAAIAVMLLHLWYLFDQWYSWPITTAISLGFDKLAFPQVTVCNTNVLHRNRFKHFKGAQELKMLVDDLKPENFVPHQFDDNYDPLVTGTDGNQQVTRQTGDNQQNDLQQGDSQQTGTEPNGNGVSPDNGIEQGTASSTTQIPANGHEVTQSTRTTRQGKLTPRARKETTVPSRTSTSTQSPPIDGGDSVVPNSRRKRFADGYDSLNLSKYYQDYKNYEEDLRDRNELDSPMDSQTVIENIFRELYMDIDRKQRMRLGHQITDMLVGCTFNGRQCPSNAFSLHQTAEYGNCWTIASDKFVVGKSGPSGGLTVILFLEVDDYLKGLTTGYGARVQFQKRDTYPFPKDEGVFISGAMETDIGLKFRTITRLGGKYGACNDGAEFKNLYNLTYTRRACQSFCRITSLIKTCNCFDDNWEEFAFKKNSTLRPCRNPKEQRCKMEILQQYRNGTTLCTCENPCGEVEYLKSVSARQWPSNEYSKVLLDWICKKDPDTCINLRKDMGSNIWAIKNNFLKLNIYYEDLNFENITETAQIELQQFLSDIGGAFGLWIGLSVLSLCEVAQLLLELFDYGVHKTLRGQQADTDGRHNDVTVSSGAMENNEKDNKGILPRIIFDPADANRLPHHLRDISPYKESDRVSHTSDRGSDKSLNKRKRHHDFNMLNPSLGIPRDRNVLNSSPDISYNSDKDSDEKGPHRRSHAHASPKPRRLDRERYGIFSNFRDDYGLGRHNIRY